MKKKTALLVFLMFTLNNAGIITITGHKGFTIMAIIGSLCLSMAVMLDCLNVKGDPSLFITKPIS